MTLNRYDRRFATLRETGQKAFIPFTMLGWPDRDRCLETIRVMIESGASALELGMAFSDPIADGPIIQRATFETLASGFKVKDAFALIEEVRKLDAEIPIGLLVYFNTVLAKGIDGFYQQAAQAGVDGVLIADLTPEMAPQVAETALKNGIAPIFIISPLTSPERLQIITEHAGGFLYVVSRLGITGTEQRFDQALQNLLATTRQHTPIPLCVGFGISTPEHARRMLEFGADGVITGSKIIQLIQEANGQPLDTVLRPFLTEMCRAVA